MRPAARPTACLGRELGAPKRASCAPPRPPRSTVADLFGRFAAACRARERALSASGPVDPRSATTHRRGASSSGGPTRIFFVQPRTRGIPLRSFVVKGDDHIWHASRTGPVRPQFYGSHRFLFLASPFERP